jgi:hypothetical protein
MVEVTPVNGTVAKQMHSLCWQKNWKRRNDGMHPRFNELMNNAGLSGNPGAGDGDGAATSSPSNVTAVIQGATDGIQQLQTVTKTNVDSITANTDALSNNSESQSSSTGPSVLGDIGSSASWLLSGGGLLGGLLGSGGLIGDAISGLMGLFGGGSSQPDFTQYQAPAAQNFELATSDGNVGDAVSGENGQPRFAPVTELGLTGVQCLGESQAASTGSGSASTGTNQQVTVNIQPWIHSRSWTVAATTRKR